MMCDHFSRVSQSNTRRAARGQPPLDYDKMENVLKIVLRDNMLPSEPPSLAQSSDRRSLDMLVDSLPSQKAGGGRPGSGPTARNSGQGGKQPASKTPDGKMLCFPFNSGSCTRSKTKLGCKNQKGVECVHACNFIMPNGGTCLQFHARNQFHK